MIKCENNIFYLQTLNSSYIFCVTKHGHLEHVFYGEKLPPQAIDSLLLKRTAVHGSSVSYDKDDPTYCLDTISMEWSGTGRGDYRHCPAEIKMPDGSFVTDFIYKGHRIKNGCLKLGKMPSARGTDDECQSLFIDMEDEAAQVSLQLIYTVFFASNVITRKTVLKNNNPKGLEIRKLMSLMLDLPDRGFILTSLHGA